MKKGIIILSFLVFGLVSCREITDEPGVVTSVYTNISDSDEAFYNKKYKVRVEIKKSDISYILYTNDVYTVGDVIQFKK